MEALLILAATGVLALGALTALGGHRRGESVPVAIAAGIFFPITWAVWYIRDEQPYRRRPAP